VALVVAITVLAASMKDWIRDVFDAQFSGDYVVNSNTFGYGGLSPLVADELNELTEVEAATGIRVGFARLTGDTPADIAYTAVDPATVTTVFDIGVTAGALETLDERGVLVDDATAESRDLAMGDLVTFQFLNGDSRELTVHGIYTEEDLAGEYVISQALHESTGADQFDFAVYLMVADGVSTTDARAALASVTDRYANAELLSRGEYLDQQAAQLDPIVNLMYALLALAILIALFSIANSISLSIHERTRELGLLRAVGMTRRQVRSVVRWESLLLALLGTGSGLVLGTFFGWAISVTVRGGSLTGFAMPYVSIVVVAALALTGALLAAVRPARRAARLDVLKAIANE
jgi:putative ABC transport system permease protein